MFSFRFSVEELMDNYHKRIQTECAHNIRIIHFALLLCVVKLDANNGFLNETDCSDRSAKDILLKFTTALNKFHHLELCINCRPAQSADSPGDSLSLFLIRSSSA